MKKILFFSLLSAMIFLACGDKSTANATENTTAATAETKTEAPATTTTAPAEAAATSASNLAYLLKLGGQYPHDAKVLETDPLKSRLKAYLKGDYKLLQDRLQTSEPIEVKGEIFFTSGCMSHACTIEECAIAVDVKNDNVFVGILQDGKATLRAEKANTTAPEVLTKWVAEKNAGN